jgi:hypothetical protein
LQKAAAIQDQGRGKLTYCAPTESVMLPCTIDAKEGQDLAVCNIPRAFMQADIDKIIQIWLNGELAELLCKIDSGLYEKYMVREGQQKQVIYLCLSKALYGTLQAALLFGKDLSGALQERGFILNPYDCCMANEVVNWKQCTILWHVDNLNISHEDENFVSTILDAMNEQYGDVMLKDCKSTECKSLKQ